MRNKKNMIIIFMIVAVLLLAIGYAAFQTRLTISGVSTITEAWDVRVISVSSNPVGRAYNISEPTYTNTTMSFNVGVKEPGDSMTFVVTLKNFGTVDAMLDSIDITSSGSDVIKYSIAGITEESVITAGSVKNFKVKTEFDINATAIPDNPTQELNITLNFVQAINNSGNVVLPDVEEDTLVYNILNDNTVKSDSGIDFKSSASTKGGTYTITEENSTMEVLVPYLKTGDSDIARPVLAAASSFSYDANAGVFNVAGSLVDISESCPKDYYTCLNGMANCTTLYQISSCGGSAPNSIQVYKASTISVSNPEDDSAIGLYYNLTNDGTTYYFRGAVENNYVVFADNLWQIVRINEQTNSVRLILSGPMVSSLNIPFNRNIGDNAYVGYMSGATKSDSLENTHSNTNNSTIKSFIESWYQKYLGSYSSYLEDAGFCNDREVSANSWNDANTGLGYSNYSTYYSSMDRTFSNEAPMFSCNLESRDLFTLSSNGKGNNKLTYPIGFLTADEVVFAGGFGDRKDVHYYLNNGFSYWLMSPTKFENGYASMSVVNSEGKLAGESVGATNVYARPVINLKSSVKVSSGNGTLENPYIIQ